MWDKIRGSGQIGLAALMLVLATGFGTGSPPVDISLAAGTRISTGPEAGESCLFVNGGQMSGRVVSAGGPAPDGTLISITFAGGPTEDVAAMNGRYAAPLLARACTDGVHWIPLELSVGGQTENVAPDSWETHLDLDAPQPVSVENPALFQTGVPPLCSLELGVVSGAIQIDGAAAPDGTIVSATTPTGLSQAVFSSGGRYMLTAVGSRCGDGSLSFIAMTLSVGGASVDVIPSEDETSQDLVVPGPTTNQGLASAGSY
jgi:hypothetical protein